VSALRAEKLSARYPGQAAARPALVDVDLEIHPGERVLLLGPNGAGKSTFIRVFAGLMHASRGKALVAGQPAAAMRAEVGVVSHATFLYDELTALENLRLYADLYGVSNPPSRASMVLEQVGLSHVGDIQVGRLSRGQQQRVTLARAIIHEPSVLLLDEPDTGLDVAAFATLESIVGSHGHTVVVTTHNLATGLRLATRVAVLAGGRIVYEQDSASPMDAAALSERLDKLAR
jgi:ABC-type multidrug transport system ATPase subunit